MPNDCKGVSLSTRSYELASGKFDSLPLRFLHLDRDRWITIYDFSVTFLKKRTLGPYIFLKTPSPSVRPFISAFLPFVSRVHSENE